MKLRPNIAQRAGKCAGFAGWVSGLLVVSALQIMGTPAALAQDEASAVGVQVAQAVAQTLVEQARISGAERTLVHSNVPGGTLMVVSYAVLWIFVFGMIFMTFRRQRRLNAELEGLNARMDAVFDGIDADSVPPGWSGE